MAEMIYCVCPDAPSGDKQFKEWDLLPDLQHECKNRLGKEVECGRVAVILNKDVNGVEKLSAVIHKCVRISLRDGQDQACSGLEGLDLKSDTHPT
jgi:hypothetical protein